MSGRSLKVTKCPEVHSRSNRAVVSASDWDPSSTPHLEVVPSPGHSFVFSVVTDSAIKPGRALYNFNPVVL